MKLTIYTDYSLRVLIYLALHENKLTNIKTIANTYNISQNHLKKVVHHLGQLGYLENIRGRNGGIKLAIEPKNINIGSVVRKTEDDFYLVECFNEAQNRCVISSDCLLKHVLLKATKAFLQILDQYTLYDLIKNKNDLRVLLNAEEFI